MTQLHTTRFAGLIGTGLFVMAAIAAPSAALATQPAPDHKVTICHATNSDTNPYITETVDIASTGYLKAGHSDHTGPVWNATLKADHIAWGDIIPAYAYGEFVFEGQNLEDGQAILDNDCALPAEDVTETTSDETTAEETTVEETTTEDVTETTTDETTTDETTTTDATGDGEVAVDDDFVTPTPDATPVGAVLGATGRPDMTPPATDTIAQGGTAGASGSGFQVILLVLAGLSTMVLVLGRVPAARRS